MLSLDAPHVLQLIREYPGGLCPIDVEGRPCLAIKASKEALLAAQINQGFKIYVAPLPFENGLTIGLISAFFDDHDEPLVITTPLFGGEEFCDAVLNRLFQEQLDIYFFDEHAREWMSYRCNLIDGGSMLEGDEEIFLLPPDVELAMTMSRAMEAWFSYRTPEDDARTITVSFCKELWPPDIAIMDMREGASDYVGGGGSSVSMLTREQNIGYFQERDIAACFKRALAAEQIILNPMRRASMKELADVVVGTGTTLVIVQAKDSPNTEASLARTIKRKLATSKRQLNEGVKQAVGALHFVRAAEPIPLSIDGDDVDLYVHNRTIISLVVIRETFPPQETEILATMRKWQARGDHLLIMDYPGFDAFTYQFATEEELVAAFKNYAAAQLARNSWIKPQSYALDAFVNIHKGAFVSGKNQLAP